MRCSLSDQICATWWNKEKIKAVGDQSKLTVKITVMVMIFPDGGYNQGSHFVDILDCAKNTHTQKSAWLMEKTLKRFTACRDYKIIIQQTVICCWTNKLV